MFFPAFVSSNFKPPPPPAHKGSAVFHNIGLTQVFECLTLLKIEVIEYGKMGFKMALTAFSET